jgi:hypothetical protein
MTESTWINAPAWPLNAQPIFSAIAVPRASLEPVHAAKLARQAPIGRKPTSREFMKRKLTRHWTPAKSGRYMDHVAQFS